jgi:hypothetical protein
VPKRIGADGAAGGADRAQIVRGRDDDVKPNLKQQIVYTFKMLRKVELL